MKNKERIRLATDEELAEELLNADFCTVCDYIRKDGVCTCIAENPEDALQMHCKEAVLKYLDMESDEE